MLFVPRGRNRKKELNMTPTYEDLGLSIKTARLSKKLTQEEVAERLGVSVTTVSNWETGLNSPSLPEAAAMADMLGISIDRLAGRAS